MHCSIESSCGVDLVVNHIIVKTKQLMLPGSNEFHQLRMEGLQCTTLGSHFGVHKFIMLLTKDLEG